MCSPCWPTKTATYSRTPRLLPCSPVRTMRGISPESSSGLNGAGGGRHLAGNRGGLRNNVLDNSIYAICACAGRRRILWCSKAASSIVEVDALVAAEMTAAIAGLTIAFLRAEKATCHAARAARCAKLGQQISMLADAGCRGGIWRGCCSPARHNKRAGMHPLSWPASDFQIYEQSSMS